MTKTRFAPSPTGLMHLGNIRTALFNFLLAKKLGGHFLLRVEDTDQARSTAEFAEALMADLRWLGITWDEGPHYQSQRAEIYQKYYQTLEQQGLAYPCFCTDQELAIIRKVQLAAGQPPRYPGTCAHLSAAEIEEKKAQGLQPTLRFRVPAKREVRFTDWVKGEQKFFTADLGDFIIRRADGSSSFMFCNAVDDALMGITHVLRGDDHLSNTPRQQLILEALQLTPPHYGHLSMILGADGAPLSKRNGSRSIRELREVGVMPKAVVNYLTRLGHYLPDPQSMNLNQLAAAFELKSLGTSAARYDEAQLQHWQREAVMQADPDTLWQWMGEKVHAKVPNAQRALFIETVKSNISVPEEAFDWAEIFFEDALEYPAHEAVHIERAGELYFREALAALENHGLDFKALIAGMQDSLNLKGKALYQPLRIALTSVSHGPEMPKIVELLGKEKVRHRLQKAMDWVAHAENL